MIRVFRATSGRELKASLGEKPVVEALTPGQLLAALERSELTKSEREAVQRASCQIEGARDANILIAANGTIFRIERINRTPAPRPTSRSSTVGWATTERGAAVVVAHPDGVWSGRAADALRFLGYAARRADRSPVETIASAPPFVILVIGSAITEELLDAASDRCAVVALVEKGGSMPLEAHGVLWLPLQARAVAAVVDPLVRRVRSGRLRLGRATPRP